MYLGVHVKCPIFLSDFNQMWTFRQVFVTASNTKRYKNPSVVLALIHVPRYDETFRNI